MQELVKKVKQRIDRLHKIDVNDFEEYYLYEFYKKLFSKINNNEIVGIYEFFVAYYCSISDDDFKTVFEDAKLCENTFRHYLNNLTDYVNIGKNITFNLQPFLNTPIGDKKYEDAIRRALGIILGKHLNHTILELESVFKPNSKNKTLAMSNTEKNFKADDTWRKIRRKYGKIDKKYKSIVDKRYIEINSIRKIMEIFQKDGQNNKSIKISDSLINNIEDSELKYHIYRVIATFNYGKLFDVNNESKKLKLSNVDYIRYMFNKAGHNMDSLSDEIVKIISEYGDFDKIFGILKILDSIDFEIINFNSIDGIKALVNTDIEKLLKIIQLVKNGIINSQFVIKNQKILYDIDVMNNENLGQYSIVNKNYKYLKSLGFSINNTELNEGLLISSDKIDKINANFNAYGLNPNVTLPKSMLCNDDFFSYIDLFIELGLDNFIKDNYFIVSDSCKMIIDRIHIANMMRLNIFDHGGRLIPEIISGNRFYVNDAELDSYIVSTSSNMILPNILDTLSKSHDCNYDVSSEFIEFDKAFSFNEYTYMFNGIPISRNKVLRSYNILRHAYPNYDKFCLLESSIIYNSILDIDNIFNIKDSIDEFFKEKQKRIV